MAPLNMRTEEHIEFVLKWADMVFLRDGPGAEYADGFRSAIRWLLGDTEYNPSEGWDGETKD